MVGMPGIEPRLHPPHGRVLPLYYIPMIEKSPRKRGFLLFRSFGQGADSTGRELELHAAKALCLNIDLEFAAGSDIGVTARVPSLGTATSHLANTTHRNIKIEYL